MVTASLTLTVTELGRDYVTMATPAEILNLVVVCYKIVVILRRSLNKFRLKGDPICYPFWKKTSEGHLCEGEKLTEEMIFCD